MITKQLGANGIIENTKKDLLQELKADLEKLKYRSDGLEIYFHDIVSNVIDRNTPSNKNQCMKLIEQADTQYFDEGLIDKSSWERQLITMAYCSIEQSIFNDDFIQELQSLLNNEIINENQSKKIIDKIDNELSKYKWSQITYEDTDTQIFIDVGFDLNFDDFKESINKNWLHEKQIIDLSNAIKILTSNKEINQNAIVIESLKSKKKLRIYFMNKDKDIDIRNLFKLDCISADTGYNLSPSAYIEMTTEQYEKEKKLNSYPYLQSFKKKEDFIKQIVKIAHKLTEKTL